MCEERQPRVRTVNQRVWLLTRSGLTLSKAFKRPEGHREAQTLQAISHDAPAAAGSPPLLGA